MPFFCVIGQETNSGKQYILGDIELSGEHNLSKNSVLKIMNLSIGQKIILPGQDLKNGIKSLWNQNIFADIQVWKVEKNEQVINLEIYLKTLPRLSKFKFTGIKKGEEDDLRKKIELKIGNPVSQNLITNSQQMIEAYLIEKGFSNTTCEISSITDTMDLSLIHI